MSKIYNSLKKSEKKHKTNTDKATPRQWTHENDCIMNDPVTNKPEIGFRIYTEGYLRAEIYKMDDSDKDKMLNAVNSHDALVNACENALYWIENDTEVGQLREAKKCLRKAISKAKGEQ